MSPLVIEIPDPDGPRAADVELHPLAKASIEQHGRRCTLILDDGTTRVRIPLPDAMSSDEPYPHQLVLRLAMRIERQATEARRLGLWHLSQIAT